MTEAVQCCYRNDTQLISRGLLRGWWFCPHRAAQAEVALGAADVFSDLFAEGFRAGPAGLVAQAVEEGEGERGALGEGERVEVEDVGLDGE